HRAPAEEVTQVLGMIGTAPNGRPWDCGACGYRTCREFAEAMVEGRTTLRQCPPYQERRAEEAQLRAAADELTGLATFRVLRERVASEIARSHRSEEPFALLFVDLDHFKQVNDRFGHQAGNEVLRTVADAIKQAVRSTDLPARYGGDEFVVMLVRTGLEGARRVGEAVREAIEDAGGRLGFPGRTVTASIGVAEYDKKQQAPEEVLVAADRALYRAKEAGGNIVASEANGT
ncbi:MAG: diguanylate cyclase, partial [Gemmatimonadales bacterium]